MKKELLRNWLKLTNEEREFVLAIVRAYLFLQKNPNYSSVRAKGLIDGTWGTEQDATEIPTDYVGRGFIRVHIN